MLNNKEIIQDLFGKIISDQCTDEEAARFFELVRELPEDDVLITELESRWNNLAVDKSLDESLGRTIHERLIHQIRENTNPISQQPVRRIHFLRTAWFRYAAMLLVMIGVGAYFWNTRQSEKPGTKQPVTVALKNNVPPGSNKAILTLSDGSKIILDSAANGQLAQQGASTIKKNMDGQIVYVTEESKSSQPPVLNTMSTPRGGQYQLTLPDGSRVWLNAESSITYPAVFSGTIREVSIIGEVYIEVAENAALPFKVKVGEGTIEVLGTHFNINAYKDEPVIKTTLLEGAVKVVKGNNRQILKPGQQAQFNNESNAINLVNNADADEVIAWKNGTFDFRDQDIETVMRQIGRWYNMDIVYEGKKPNVRILSMLNRNTDLTTVLKSLELIGLRFRIESSLTKEQVGKIIVQP